METTKVIAWIDIQAPLREVYDAVLNVEKRMQLSPLWGATELEKIDQDYPREGSQIEVQLKSPPYTSYSSIITRLNPFRKLAYRLMVERDTQVTWHFQEVSSGTRLIYQEEFKVNEDEKEDFSQSVRDVIQDWLKNIKRYTELREGRLQRAAKWFVDHHYLHLRPDQRKTIQAILFMHIVGMISSVMAIIAWGVAFALK
jgi:hypothetical protein